MAVPSHDLIPISKSRKFFVDMLKRLVTILLSISVVAGTNLLLPQTARPVAAQNNPLAPYRWQNRLLLVFVPKVSDERLVSIQARLKEVECEFKERDLLLGVFATNYPSRIGNDEISGYDSTFLRSKYGIKSQQFAVILIGKDGQPKSELSELPAIDKIFSRIDTMPMRREEMASNPNACEI